MTRTADPDSTEHEEIWLLLPWLANDRLTDTQRERALRHVLECAACSAELAQQRQLYEALATPERISYTHGPSLAKLMHRIEAAANAPLAAPEPAAAWSGHRPLQARAPAASGSPHGAHGSPDAGRWVWRTAALACAASALLTLALATSLASRWLTPVYQVRGDPQGPGSAPVLHIIFVSTLTVGQVEELLRASGAQLVEGPAGETGVFGIRPLAPAKDAALQLQQLAAQLRNDPRIRWVEPLATTPVSAASSHATAHHP